MKEYRSILGLLFLLILPVLLLLPDSAESQETAVSPGDSLMVVVVGHPELSARLQVNSLGDLLIPNGGALPVAGLIPSVIAERILDVYRPYFGRLRVTVTRPEEPEPAAVSVPGVERVATVDTSAVADTLAVAVPAQPTDTLAPIEPGARAADTLGAAGLEVQPADTIPTIGVEAQPRDTTADLARDSVLVSENLLEPGIELPADTVVLSQADTVPPVPEPVQELQRDTAVTMPDSVSDPVTVPVRERQPDERDIQGPEPTFETFEEAREASPAQRSSWYYGLAAVGGVASTASPSHGFGGVLATGGWRRIGILGIGEYGSGAGYSSLLLSGGLTYEAYTLGPFSVMGTGGYAFYSEESDGGVKRDFPSIMLGGLARLRLGPVVPAVAITGILGNYDGNDVEESFSANFVRVSFGIGF